MKSAVLKSIVHHLFVAIFLFSIFTLQSLLFAPSAHAQCAPPGTPANPATPDQIVNAVNNCAISTGTFDDKVFNINQTMGLTNSLSGMIIGATPLTPRLSAILQGQSALAATSRYIAATFGYPPASGVEYFAQQIKKLDPIQPTYAQTGVGFNALRPTQQIWGQFRNISYTGFVIVFIVIGFMIMFRAKVSPQAVATVQDSVPRIVIALILVTFSYAIVGLIIDFMFIILNIAINILPVDPGQSSRLLFEHSIIGAITNSWGELVVRTSHEIQRVVFETLGVVGGTILDLVTGNFLGNLGGLIVGFAALFMMFRIFFMLLMAYISIVLLTIFAPFILLFQALPGNNGAMSWLKQVVANVAIFPAVALMILLAGIFGNIQSFGGSTGRALQPGDIGQFPLMIGGFEQDTVSYLIGLGILFMIPTVGALIKKRLGVEGGIAFGGAGAAALGGAAGALVSSPVHQVVSPVTKAMSWKYGEDTARSIGSALPFRKTNASPGAGVIPAQQKAEG